MLSSCLKQVRRGRQFRAVRLRNTPPLPAISSPTPLPENSLPPPPSLLFTFPEAKLHHRPSYLHLLSADFPAHCPSTFIRKNIPPPNAQTRIRIQPRNLKIYSGGERRWLTCSFECFIYLFLPLIFIFTWNYLFVWQSSHYLLKWEGVFIPFSATLFCCHREKQMSFDSRLTNPLICEVSLRSVSECKI